MLNTEITKPPINELKNIALPFDGELPSESMAIRFWDHLIEEHLDIEKNWKYHSQHATVDQLIAERRGKDIDWKTYGVTEVKAILTEIANQLQPTEIVTRIRGNSTAIYEFKGKKWIFHLGIEPSIYPASKRQSINIILDQGFRTTDPSQEAKDVFARSAQIFLDHCPFEEDFIEEIDHSNTSYQEKPEDPNAEGFEDLFALFGADKEDE